MKLPQKSPVTAIPECSPRLTAFASSALPSQTLELPLHFAAPQLRKKVLPLMFLLWHLVLPVFCQETREFRAKLAGSIHEHLAANYQADGTNSPLLALTSLQAGLHSYFIPVSGEIIRYEALDAFTSTRSDKVTLRRADLELVLEAINHLPQAANSTIPSQRQMYVSGVRSNTWYKIVFDSDNLPMEARKILKILSDSYISAGRSHSGAVADRALANPSASPTQSQTNGPSKN